MVTSVKMKALAFMAGMLLVSSAALADAAKEEKATPEITKANAIIAVKIPPGSINHKWGKKVEFSLIEENKNAKTPEEKEVLIGKMLGRSGGEWDSGLHGCNFSVTFGIIETSKSGVVKVRMDHDATWKGKAMETPIYTDSNPFDMTKAKDGVINLGKFRTKLKK